MKYAKFLVTISLICASFHSFACVPSYCSPSEYYLFHLVNLPDGPEKEFNLNSHENCLLWQQQAYETIPLDDIYLVVYKYDLETLMALKSGSMPKAARGNKMAKWLTGAYGEDALDFLILAKNCEWLRCKCQSPWYYPSKKDPVRYSLNEVAEVARQKSTDYYGERYALQAVRAMTTLCQYEEIIRFWNEIEKQIPDGFLRQMALSYVAGAHVHLGNTDFAKSMYIMANDMKGLLECDLRYHSDMSRVEKMELLYEVYPDCPDFRLKLWKILGKVEPDRKWEDDWRWGVYREDERVEIDQLAVLCDRVLNENAKADRALWAYAATYIAHLKGDDPKADQYLKMAERAAKDKNLEDAIKVMRIYIDAQTSTYDKAYEQKLFAQLRWLQEMIEKDIDKEVIDGFNMYQLSGCYSYYYWNDAMRCILLGTVCPKLIKQGNTTLALQLANMSSYTLPNEIPAMLYKYRNKCSFNYYDYSCHFAEMMDSLSAKALIDYTNIALKPQTEFQRFLNAHSYIDSDYLNEMVGTHCLREMRYADAEHYLSKVSFDYFTRTNVYRGGYLNSDPFSVTKKRWNHGVDAKLQFAKTMNALEQEIASANNPNRKAMLMIDFGIGICNSFDRCWALTQYRCGWVDCFESVWETGDLAHEAMERAERLFSKAFCSFTDDEYAAQAQLLFCNHRTIEEQYPETLAAAFVRGHCDVYIDYHGEKMARALTSPNLP